MGNLVAKVYVDKAVYHIDKPFDYLVPEPMHGTLQRGCRVLVPFGGGKQQRQGIVDELVFPEELHPRIKVISAQLDGKPVLTEEMFRIARFLVRNTFCTFYDAVKTMIPTGLNVDVSRTYRLARRYLEEELGGFTYPQRELIRLLAKERTRREVDAFLASQKGTSDAVLQELVDRQVVTVNDSVRRRVGEKTVRLLCLSRAFHSGAVGGTLTPKQQEVVQFLEQNITAEKKETMYFCAVGESVIRTLVKKGVLAYREQEVYRIPDSAIACTEQLSDLVLSPEQEQVFRGLCTLLHDPAPQAALLYGVTGSGKTEVYVKLIEQAVADGRQALMLVPEIALTPQMVRRFKSLFGQAVAVMHSSLSMGERLDEYRRVERGEAAIVVGTRSAVFAPFQNLGVIIMDEEGEASYKSDAAPRYHAREIAKFRCVEHRALLLMASATPSVESWYQASCGKYRLFRLGERYAGARLPDVYLVDMKAQQQSGNASLLSLPLAEELVKNRQRGEQSIVLINRRGYQTIAQCIACGEAVTCPHCDAALTYHRDNGYMMCHYCGHSARFQKHCPSCGSEHLKLSGIGTQKVEEEVKALLPEAQVLRMDADTTYSRYAYGEKFEAFREGKYDVLIGTQMIAKGLDFPNVTLVGVLGTDAGLYSHDYRGVERVFSLVTQVVGRGGRAEKSGRACIQTYLPDHPVLNYAARQDYEAFYQDEIVSRKALRYPPFFDLCVITFSGGRAEAVHTAAEGFLDTMKQLVPDGVHLKMQVIGPMKAAMYRMGDKYRETLLVKCRMGNTMKTYLSACLKAAGKDKYTRGVSVMVDVNGDVQG